MQTSINYSVLEMRANLLDSRINKLKKHLSIIETGFCNIGFVQYRSRVNTNAVAMRDTDEYDVLSAMKKGLDLRIQALVLEKASVEAKLYKASV